MSQAERTSLRSALSKFSVTYGKMAAEGGLKQLYVQVRAITNKSAMKALEKANVIYHKRFLLDKEIRSISDAELSVIDDEVLEVE